MNSPTLVVANDLRYKWGSLSPQRLAFGVGKALYDLTIGIRSRLS